MFVTIFKTFLKNINNINLNNLFFQKTAFYPRS